MAMFVNCSCGARVPAETWDCGLDKTCTSCGGAVRIPDLITLKSLNGDRYPGLSAIQKIKRTVELLEPPFDGFCHVCGHNRASQSRQVTLHFLQERVIENDGGIRLTPLGVSLEVGGTIEYRQQILFPFHLCNQCHVEFERSRAEAVARANRSFVLKAVGLIAVIFGLAMGLMSENMFIATVTIGVVLPVVSIVGRFAWIAAAPGMLSQRDWFMDEARGVSGTLPKLLEPV